MPIRIAEDALCVELVKKDNPSFEAAIEPKAPAFVSAPESINNLSEKKGTTLRRREQR